MFHARPSFGLLSLVIASASLATLATLACSDTVRDPPAAGGNAGAASGSGGRGSGTAGSSGSAGTTAQAGRGNVGGTGGAAGADAIGGTGGAVTDAGTSGPDGSSGDAGPDREYVLIDFAGASTASEIKTVGQYDIRDKFTFAVTGDHTASATVEVVNSQSQLAFAAANPGLPALQDVFRFVKIPSATGDGSTWGGWSHIIFDLGAAIPEALITALPRWDNDSSTLVPGTKVIQMDVYYDDTVDPNYDWTNVIGFDAAGYSVYLDLVNYANHATGDNDFEGGGYYVGYFAYVTAPNTWVTLTFDAADAARAENFYSSGSVLAASPSQVTGIDITPAVTYDPAAGYDPADSNRVYLRNLRIVDAL
jgi:hypothetical protein